LSDEDSPQRPTKRTRVASSGDDDDGDADDDDAEMARSYPRVLSVRLPDTFLLPESLEQATVSCNTVGPFINGCGSCFTWVSSRLLSTNCRNGALCTRANAAQTLKRRLGAHSGFFASTRCWRANGSSRCNWSKPRRNRREARLPPPCCLH
jgi:hypothetical protein